jgi:hypothetical protein
MVLSLFFFLNGKKIPYHMLVFNHERCISKLFEI